MFVQGPQIIKQNSDNSEDGSDDEGPEDILQVNFSQQNELDISTYFVVIFRIIEKKYYKLL